MDHEDESGVHPLDEMLPDRPPARPDADPHYGRMACLLIAGLLVVAWFFGNALSEPRSPAAPVRTSATTASWGTSSTYDDHSYETPTTTSRSVPSYSYDDSDSLSDTHSYADHSPTFEPPDRYDSPYDYEPDDYSAPSYSNPGPGDYIPYPGNGLGPTPCADGTWSHSAGSGTCSYHGGEAG